MPSQPLNVPVIQKPTPIVLDELLIESTDSNKALYDRMLEKGHYHPNQQKYPGYRFLKQEPTEYGQVRYYWANDYASQDSYNAVVSYASDANAFPTFVRSYRVLRAEYLVSGLLTKGLAFTGIASIAVTNGGSGFTLDFPVTFTGGGGSGAAGIAIVDQATGTVLRVELNNVGLNYTAAPTIGFGNGSGTGAAATAVIQPASAVLTSEVHGKLPEDDPYQSLYDKVTRTWDTLPGPTINSTRIDFDGKTVNIATTKKLISAINSGETLGGGTWTRTTMKEADSTLFAYEVVETRDVPGNAIPLPTETREAGDAVTSTVQLVDITTIVTGESIVSTNWERQFGKTFEGSALVGLQVTESRPHTGNVLPFDKLDPLDQFKVTGTKQLDLISNIVSNVKEDTSGSNWTRTTLEPMENSHLVAFQVTESRTIIGALVAEEAQISFDGVPLYTTRQLVAVGSIVDAESISGSNWIKQFGKEHDGSSKVALQYTETRLATGAAIPLPTELREAGDVVTITNQLVPLPITSSEAVDGGGHWVKSFGKPFNSALVGILVKESRPATGNTRTYEEIHEAGDVVTITEQLVPVGSIVKTESVSGSNWLRSYGKANQESHLVAWQMVESRVVPGGVAESTELREAGDIVTVDRQLVLVGTEVVGESISGSDWLRQYAEAHPDSVLVIWQRNESRLAAGNPTTTTELREAGDIVTVTKTLCPAGSIVTSEAIDGSNNWVRSFGRAYEGSHEVAWQIVESRPATGGIEKSYKPVEAGDTKEVDRQLVPVGSLVTGENQVGGSYIRQYAEENPESVLVLWQITESRPVAGGSYSTQELHENGDVTTITRNLNPISSGGATESVTSGAWVKYYTKPYEESRIVVWLISESRPIPGNGIVTKERDSDGSEAVVTKTLKAVPITTSDSITSNVWTRITVEPMGDSDVVAWEIVRVRSVNVGHAPTVTGSEFDPNTGNLLAIAKTLVAQGTSGTAIQSDGSYSEVAPVNDVVSELVTKHAIGASAISGRTWHEFRHVALPEVLTVFELDAFNDSDGNTIWVAVQHALKNYSATYDITVTETWKSTAFTGLSAQAFFPAAIDYLTPFCSVSIPPCLHGSITISGNTASDGSTPAGNGRFYAYIAFSRTFSATNVTSLSGNTYTISDSQRPYNGGFLRRTESITV